MSLLFDLLVSYSIFRKMTETYVRQDDSLEQASVYMALTAFFLLFHISLGELGEEKFTGILTLALGAHTVAAFLVVLGIYRPAEQH